jgi:hypothetical protein
MRSSRAIFAALTALNVLAFAALPSSGGDDELAPRLSLQAEAPKDESPRGAAVPFRLRGEGPWPVAATPVARRDRPPASAADTAESQIDSSGFAFLGTMTSPEGRIEYFFKSRATDRVYSSGRGDGGIAVLDVNEKEFLIEIDGTKYKVQR